jgi:hypothetical protein
MIKFQEHSDIFKVFDFRVAKTDLFNYYRKLFIYLSYLNSSRGSQNGKTNWNRKT